MQCIVLGAGASACAKAPLIGDFQQKAQLVAEAMPDNYGHDGAKVFRETVGYWTSNFPHLNIEEFYVMAELQQLLEAPNPVTARPDLGFGDCVQAMIAKTLAARMKGPPSKHHEQLARVLIARQATAVTMNWDLSVDNALNRLGASPGLGHGEAYDMGSGQRLAGGSPQLLKLHGSLNWWVCDAGHLVVQGSQKSVADAWDMPKPDCPIGACSGKRVSLQPLFVPPTSQKMVASKQSAVLKPIWRQASKALSTSEQVVFVGYSFPATDVQFRTFVQKALLENRALTGVTIVSDRKFGNAKVRFEDHYGAVLQPFASRVEVRFEYDGFESWVEKL
ncbi:MAG TPA: hypothetical protein VM327_08605 [Candidatus Thermoplasmatota archaeon]|nr:hypothetical protein [Candidatus Thermoplasmatota archaeon]